MAANAEAEVGQNVLHQVLKRGFLNSDAPAICSLISSSKVAAALVAERCKGALVLGLEPSGFKSYFPPQSTGADRGTAQEAWLRRNGSLVRGLSCRHTAGHCRCSVGRVCHILPHPALMGLLPTLVSSTPQLSSLQGEVSLLAAGSAAGVQQIAANLGALTGLTHLVLYITDCEHNGGPGPVMYSLQKLSALRSCELCIVGTGPGFMAMRDAGLQHLPAWLTSLRLGVKLGLPQESEEAQEAQERMAEAGMQAMMMGMGFPELDGPTFPTPEQQPLLLGHLTALKELRPTTWTWHMPELDIWEGDVLPPNLTALELNADSRTLSGTLEGDLAAPTIKPLTKLTRLQDLSISSSTLPATQLQHLATALASLTAMTLGYKYMAAAAAAAPAWTTLPLVGLSLSTSDSPWRLSNAGGPTLQVVLSALSQLSGLGQLSIVCGSLDVTPQQLAATLAPLTTLKKLELQGILKAKATPPTHTRGNRRPAAAAKESNDAAAAEGAAVLSHQIAALPNLVHLTAQGTHDGGAGMPVDPDIIAAGANARQLTHLKLGAL